MRYRQESRAALADQIAWVGSQTLRSPLVERAKEILGSFQPAAQHQDRTSQKASTMSWRWLATRRRDQYRQAMRRWGPPTKFGRVFVWTPDTAGSRSLRSRLDKALPEDLLAYYAPAIVQQTVSAPSYAPEADRIGEVTLEPDMFGRLRVHVDTSKPTVYGYWLKRPIHGRDRYQLVYTAWYPERPALVSLDPDAGAVDGVVIRLTLDTQNRALVYETMSACGRFHQFYPMDRLEQAACKQFGDPAGAQAFALANVLPEPNVGPVIRMVVAGGDAAGSTTTQPVGCAGRAAVFCTAGRHLCDAVRSRRDRAVPDDPARSRTYRLAPYRQLETIRVLGQYHNMFGPDGLVRGASRTVGTWMMPLGVLSAGQPRQRGTQVIHLDETDFDDPDLLDRYLRLPNGF